MPPADLASAGMLQTHLDEVLDPSATASARSSGCATASLDGEPRTLEEVGRAFGVTRERVRQIEAKSLAKLRHPHLSDQLRDYLG